MALWGFVVSNAKFRADFARLMHKAGDRADLVVRKAALTLHTSMVERSPVDTGRFKGNWNTSINTVNTATSAQADKSGAGAIAGNVRMMASWKAGQTIYMTNSLPYAQRLEYGYSVQAPGGMVRLTVQNFQRAIAEAVRGLP